MHVPVPIILVAGGTSRLAIPFLLREENATPGLVSVISVILFIEPRAME